MNIAARKPKILFISSGATVTGVPIYFINLITWFKLNTDFDITILTAFGGPLEIEYKRLAPTIRWDGTNKPGRYENIYIIRLVRRMAKRFFRIHVRTYQEKILSGLISEGFDLIYVNSVASLWIFEEIHKKLRTKTILHVHELQMSILQFCGAELLKKSLPHFDHFIVISNAVELNLKGKFNVPDNLMSLVYTFVDVKKSKILDVASIGRIIRKQIGIPEEAFVVASSGTTDWRKGADLVVHIARKVSAKTVVPVHFIWIGGDDSSLEFHKLNYDLEKLELQQEVHFLGIKERPLDYFAAADIFMLCSREDPVGLVALEAASLKKPVLCFDQAGGMPEFVESDCGVIVPYLDLDAMAEQIIKLESDRPLLAALGENASRKVERHDIQKACKEIEAIIRSVIES